MIFDGNHDIEVALPADAGKTTAQPKKQATTGKPVYKGTKGKLLTDFHE